MTAFTIEPDIDSPPPKSRPYVMMGNAGNEQYMQGYEVLRIEHTGGVVPSKAIIRECGIIEETDPKYNRPNRTLNPLWGTKYGSRVKIMDGDRVVFLGSLAHRNDQADGTVLHIAIDDRHLLNLIPVRGALVKDATVGEDPKVKFISRFKAQFNPKGLWNCTGIKIEGKLYPVFSDTAYLGANYEAPNVEYGGVLKDDGTIVPWTPRMVLLYLQLLANIGEEYGIQGIQKNRGWRSIAQSKRLLWEDYSVTSISASELVGENDIDPLDRKMPDISFQGKTMLRCIMETLNVIDTIGFGIEYRTFNGKPFSSIRFYHKYPITEGKVVKLQRIGKADIDNADTIYDFQVFEDSRQTFESIMVEGNPIYVETELSCTPDDIEDSSLKPAWSDVELAAFKYIINGGTTDDNNPGDYAQIPQSAISDEVEFDNVSKEFKNISWDSADGSGGRPLIYPRTPAAVALARSILPKVYKCFYIDSSKIKTSLYGFDGKYIDEDTYPILNYKRPILSEQLQYMISNLGDKDSIENMLKTKYPVRVQVKKDGEDSFHDSIYTSLRVTNDGLIWLDNACESLDGADECIYDLKLTEEPNGSYLKSIKINAAMPLDHRVFSYQNMKTINKNHVSPFTSDYISDLGSEGANPLPMQYIDSLGSYMENHQVNSSPTSNSKYIIGGNDISVPINRILPPGSEQKDAEYAALRKLVKSKNIRKISSFKLIGIRYDYRVGHWLKQIQFVVGKDMTGYNYTSADTGVYTINAPIENITYNYLDQSTAIGGLISEF